MKFHVQTLALKSLSNEVELKMQKISTENIFQAK